MPKAVKGRGRPRAVGGDRERVVDAILLASRVLVGVAARSLAAVDPDVTLPQYRALVVLATAGPKNLGRLSELLEVHSSTATRLCDRLVAKGLIDRAAATADRREIVLSLTRKGRGIVDRVTQRRRAEIARIVDRIPVTQRTALIGALQRFGEAAGEVPEQAWSLGWATA
jgi:DNA-binding MarR family transcriptional regulator